MDRKFLLILATILTLGLSFASCRSELEPMPESSSDGMVTLVLDLGINPGPVAAPASRAEEVEYEPAANIYEKVNTLRIIIVRPGNIVEVNQLITGKTTDGDQDFFLPAVATQLANLGRYSFKVVDGEKKDIYLIANEAAISADSKAELDRIIEGGQLDGLSTLTLSVQPQEDGNGGYYFDNSGLSEASPVKERFIPMTEVFTIDVNSKGSDSHIVQNGTNGIVYEQIANLFVTRVTTKFSFSAESSNLLPGAELKIKNITIHGLGTAEFLFPSRETFYSPAKNVVANERMITETTFPVINGTTPPTYPFTFSPESFTMTGSEGPEPVTATYEPLIYFLESSFQPTPENPFTVTLVTEVDGKEHTWESKPLPNLPFLYRNTHVRIHFEFINPATLEATVKLVPWIGVTLDYTFGFNELIPWERNPQ